MRISNKNSSLHQTEVTSLSCVPDKPQMILIFYIIERKEHDRMNDYH